MTYLSLIADRAGCSDLQGLLGQTFNMVSDRAGSKIKVEPSVLEPNAVIALPVSKEETNHELSSLRSSLAIQTEALKKIHDASKIFTALQMGRADMASIYLWSKQALAQSEGSLT